MEKQKNGELSRMFGYAGKFHVLTVFLYHTGKYSLRYGIR